MKRVAMGLLAVMLLGMTACGQKSAEKQFVAMDTVISFRAEGKEAEDAIQAAEQTMYALEAGLSRTRETSEVSVLNQAEGGAVEVSDMLRCLLNAAKDYERITDGAFDITIAPVCDAWGFTTEHAGVPDESVLKTTLALIGSDRLSVETQNGKNIAMLEEGQEIDLGGIAKGYASDLMETLYREYDVTRGTVSLGGNVYVKGEKADGSPWQVGIQDPKQPENGALVGMVGLCDAFAVTSGGYQRFFEQDGVVYHHIIDPSTGYPADSGLTSVTVIAGAKPRENADEAGMGTMCDALSTALFVMGEEKALTFWRESGLDFELVLVTEDGRVLVTDGIAEQFTEAEGSGYKYETVS